MATTTSKLSTTLAPTTNGGHMTNHKASGTKLCQIILAPIPIQIKSLIPLYKRLTKIVKANSLFLSIGNFPAMFK